MNVSPGPVSIITVCLNEKARIERTIHSIISQRCRAFEWIVQDGNSTDGTVEILKAYRAHMTHFSSEPDGGVYAAMNRAAARAQGQWLLFLNGGDALAGPDVLADMQPYLTAPGDAVVLGAHLCVWPDGRPPVRKELHGLLGRDHFYRRTINHQSAFIGRRVFDRFGPYDASFRVIADHDFFARSVLGGAVVRCVPVLVAEYDMTGLTMAMKRAGRIEEERARIRRLYPRSYRGRRQIGAAISNVRAFAGRMLGRGAHATR